VVTIGVTKCWNGGVTYKDRDRGLLDWKPQAVSYEPWAGKRDKSVDTHPTSEDVASWNPPQADRACPTLDVASMMPLGGGMQEVVVTCPLRNV
jgi:hypothetical protein